MPDLPTVVGRCGREPDPFMPAPGEDKYIAWKAWLRDFDDYLVLNEDFYQTGKRKTALLWNLIGREWKSVRDGLEVKIGNPTDAELLDKTKQVLTDHFAPMQNVIVARHNFRHCLQGSMTVSEYEAELERLAKECDFDKYETESVKDQSIRDQFIFGMNDKGTQQKLLELSDLTRKKAFEKARAVESSRKNQNTVNTAGSSSDAFASDPSTVLKVGIEPQSGKSAKFDGDCHFCGIKGHMAKNCYKKAKADAVAHGSGRGSTVADGRGRGRGNRGRGQVFRGRGQATAPKWSFFTMRQSLSKHHLVSGTFRKLPISFVADTGADLSIISEKFVNDNGLDGCIQPESEPCSAVVGDGTSMSFRGCIDGELDIQGQKFRPSFKVSDKLPCTGILGMDVLSSFAALKFRRDGPILELLVKSEDKSAMPERYKKLVEEFSDVFDKPLQDARFKNFTPHPIIELEPGANSYKAPVRMFPPAQQAALDEQIPKLLEAGVIERSTSPWRHQPVVVKKRNGGHRIAINYKPVNAVTKDFAYPFPRIDELISKCAGYKYFSVFDFSQMYHQIPLHDDNKEKTAFYANGELFQYTMTSYGLKNAVAYATETMHDTFGHLDHTVTYVDDINAMGKDDDQCYAETRRVLELAREHGISFNLSKCAFGQRKISFLGHIIEDGTVRPDPNRLKRLMDLPEPKTLKQLSRLLGMLSYLRNNVKDFAEIAYPLYEMSRFGKVEWNDTTRAALDKLKVEISKSVCAIPLPDEHLTLETDASDHTIAAYLRTESGQPVTFASRALRGAERHYDIIEKEALAIFWSITEKFRSLLLGRQFTVYSDHQSLQWLLTTVKPTRKLLRWRMELQEFRFHVAYKPGKDNVVADSLSRAFLMISEQSDEDAAQFDLEQSERLSQLNAIPSWEVRSHQKNDPQLRIFFAAMKAKAQTKPAPISDVLWAMRKECVIENGILLHREGPYRRFVIPQTLREKLLALAHVGHPGRDAMIANMRQKVYWPKMRQEAAEHCAKCRVCAFTKPRFVAPPTIPLIVTSPMELVAMDYIGPVPEAQGGKKYLLVFIDMFTRFPEVYPVSNLETDTLITCFRDWIARYGYPDAVLSDRGTQFESEKFRAYCKQFGIIKRRTNAYHPQGNGICERFNGTIWRKIKVLQQVHRCSITKWPGLLPMALFDYRNSVHSGTGYSPFQLMYQFNVRSQLPVRRQPTAQHRRAKRNMRQNRGQRSKYYNRKAEVRHFYSGQDAVLRNEHPTKANKFGITVQVVEQLNSHVIRVRFPNGKVDTVSAARLSPLPPPQDVDDDVWFPAEETVENVPVRPAAVASPVQGLRRSSRRRNERNYAEEEDEPVGEDELVEVQKRFPQGDGTYGEHPVA